ncbi:uncharacterized protein M6G45_013697 [Spheniscus humboldti]
MVLPTNSRGDIIAPGSVLPRAGLSPPLSPHGLHPLPQYLLICYKSWWDGAFQVTEELSTTLRLRLESGSEGSEEEDGGSTSALESGQAGGYPAWRCGQVGVSLVQRPGRAGVVERWREQRCGARAAAEQQRPGDTSEAVLGRLEALEADVRFLCTELGAEKLLWSSRFLELLQEQQGLRQRLQERPWQWDSSDSPELPGETEDQSACGSEGESPDAAGWSHPGSRPCAQVAFWGQRLRDRQKIASRALCCPAQPCPALPCPFSRTAAISQKREAAWGELLPPALPRAGHSRLMPRATPGADCTLGRLSPVEPSKDHLPDPLQLVGSLQEQGVRSLPAPSHLAQAGDTAAMDGLQKPSAALFTSSLAR